MRNFKIFFLFIFTIFLFGCSADEAENVETHENMEYNGIEEKLQNYPKLDSSIKEDVRQMYYLWCDFNENISQNKDPSEDFINSGFINKLKEFFSLKESLSIEPDDLGRILSQNDLFHIDRETYINGKKINVRAICYTADIFVQAVTDKPIKSKWIFIQYWTDKDFNCYVLSDGDYYYLDDIKLYEHNGKLNALVCTETTGEIPRSKNIWSLKFEDGKIQKGDAFAQRDESLQPETFGIWDIKWRGDLLSVCVDMEDVEFSFNSPVCRFEGNNIKFSYTEIDGSIYELDIIYNYENGAYVIV